MAVFAVAVLLGGPLLASLLRSPAALGTLLVAVLGAYLLVLGIDGPSAALSPFGPSQNSRYFGLSNLLETMLLVPAFGGAALLFRRFGWIAFAGTALLAFATVAGNRFGADGGGAVVLAGGFAACVLLSGAAGGRRDLRRRRVGAYARPRRPRCRHRGFESRHEGARGRAGRSGRPHERVELPWARATADCTSRRGGADAGRLRVPRRANLAPAGCAERVACRAGGGRRDRRLARRERLADRRAPRRSHELCRRRRGYASRAMARYFALLVAVLALAVVAGCGEEESSPAPRP